MRATLPAMAFWWWIPLLSLLSACGGEPTRDLPWTRERVAADLAIARSGCVRCHAESVEAPGAQARALQPGPALVAAARWQTGSTAESFLRRHHGGVDAADLAAWVRSLAVAVAPPTAVATSPARRQRGEQLVREQACGACHAPGWLADLGQRVDHDALVAFLQAPADRRPDLVHPALTAAEAGDAAAYLLRDQVVRGEPMQGFSWQAWLMPIDDAGLPDLAAAAPFASGTASRIDAQPAPRDRHYALAFDAVIDVPAAGEWTFTTGSDDSSWLWIDGELVVRNEGLAPHRRRSGKAKLAAGQHDLRVVFTQAAGEASLEALWSGPGVEEQELPAARAQVPVERLVPRSAWPVAGEAAVARGRAAARARRCDACHAFEDPAFRLLPAPPPARPFAQLRPGPCPEAPAAPALLQAAREAAQCEPSPAADLARAMLRDGCLACHRRDGQGGLPPAVQAGLATIEDLGDEGRLPPDLTAVGRRLRPQWLERVLAEGVSVRPYLRLRMPKVPPARARQYAAWFAEVDGATDAARPAGAPTFDAALVQRGQQLVGLGGRNCITCHGVADYPSLGARGMDLLIQHERLQPDWLRSFLLEPAKLRPGTRMPALWWRVDDDARAEVAAIAAWLSLGAAAPLPPGVKPKPGSSLLVPGERPLLHGAFLAGVSARGLCVGSDLRVHFAWDLAVPRLVWLWRGDFVDAAGTWHGRAGRLIEPAGRDWRVLDDLVLANGAERRLRGQRRTPDGWPVLRVVAGDVEYEDEARAVLRADGVIVVRTLRALRGALAVGFPPPTAGLALEVGGVPARDRVLAPGEALEIVYRW